MMTFEVGRITGDLIRAGQKGRRAGLSDQRGLRAGAEDRGDRHRRDVEGARGAMAERRHQRAVGRAVIHVAGASQTEAAGINWLGHIGGTFIDSQGHAHGFILRAVFSRRLTFPARPTPQIDDADAVVGAYSSPNQNVDHAFLWAKGKYTNVDDPNASDTLATSMNNRHQFVGMNYCPFCGRVLSRELWNQEKKK